MGSKDKPWKKKAIIALYIVAIINILVSTERIVFDALGQMWVILFTNAITIIATLFCILGTLCKKNTAIIAFIVFTILALAVNIVIVLIFNDVGIFADKDNYLSLTLNDQHWWRDHGFLCYTVCNHGNDASDNDANNGGGGGGGGEGGNDNGGGHDEGSGYMATGLLMPLQESATNGSAGLVIQKCFASYVVIETAHASLNMLLMIITLLLSFCALNLKKHRSRKLVPTTDQDNDSFRYMGIGRYGGNAPRREGGQRNQPSFYKLSDSFDSSTSSTRN